MVSLLVWAGSAAAVGWLLLAGRGGAAVAAAPWLAAAALLVYLTQWQPRLIVGADGFDVVNGLRRHRIPFAAVDDVEVRYTVTVKAAGKRYVSWGAPTPPSAFGAGFEQARDWKERPFGMLPSNERMGQSPTPGGRDAIVRAWQDARQASGTGGSGWSSADRTVVSEWNVPMLALGLLLAGWCLVSVLF
ncbi:PH domain-containing protein [Arthrobacter sp. C9C5]|uniref:PH domain-containing protein n=1 Tax=Arthrobacter sp. C9C5 TaxID=2735267 RepID=UPI001584CF66|nr:PH domain-containing protein [Arthrobacter sp. C9C5]